MMCLRYSSFIFFPAVFLFSAGAILCNLSVGRQGVHTPHSGICQICSCHLSLYAHFSVSSMNFLIFCRHFVNKISIFFNFPNKIDFLRLLRFFRQKLPGIPRKNRVSKSSQDCSESAIFSSSTSASAAFSTLVPGASVSVRDGVLPAFSARQRRYFARLQTFSTDSARN